MDDEIIGNGAKPLGTISESSKKVYDKLLTTWFNKNWIRPAVSKSPEGKYARFLSSYSVKSNHKALYESILSEYTKPNVVKTHLSAMVYHLKVSKAPQKTTDYYSDESTKMDKVSKKESDQNVRILNKYTLDDIKKILRDMIDKTDPNKPLSPNTMNKLLLLTLLTQRPPPRTEYSEMVLSDKTRIGGQTNYYNTKTKRFTFSRFKTDKRGPIITAPLDKETSAFIEETIRMFPRKYLLSNPKDGNQPLGYQSMNRLLISMLGKGYGMNQIRSIYVSDFLSKKHSNEEKIKLAEQMMTSPETLDRYYKNKNIMWLEDEDKFETETDSPDTNDLPEDEEDQPVTAPPVTKTVQPKVDVAPSLPTDCGVKTRQTRTKLDKPSREDDNYNSSYYEKNREKLSSKASKRYQDPETKKKDDRNHVLNRAVKHQMDPSKYSSVKASTLRTHCVTQEDIDKRVAERTLN